MFSSRSCNICALSLLKKNKEENTITYQESPPWLPTMFKTPCVETILYPEFLRSNRQAKISGRTIDARNHRPLLTSSPAYSTFLETTENYYWDTCGSPVIKCLCFFVVFFFPLPQNGKIVPRGHWALNTMTTNCDPMRCSHADHACYLDDD